MVEVRVATIFCRKRDRGDPSVTNFAAPSIAFPKRGAEDASAVGCVVGKEDARFK